MSSSTTNYQEIKYEFTPAFPEPGDEYDKFRERALNAMATSDDRGWSLADHLLGTDEDVVVVVLVVVVLVVGHNEPGESRAVGCPAALEAKWRPPPLF